MDAEVIETDRGFFITLDQHTLGPFSKQALRAVYDALIEWYGDED